MAETYKIVRYYADSNKRKRTMYRGYTLEQAQEWCKREDTSSATTQTPSGKEATRRMGPWFEGYEKE